MASNSGTALLWHDGALGDLLLSLPLIRWLRGVHGRLVLAARPPQGRLIDALGEVDGVLDASSGAWVPLYGGDAVPELWGYEAIYCFSRREETPFTRALLGSAPEARLIRTAPPLGLQQSVALFQLEQVRRGPDGMSMSRLFAPVAAQGTRSCAPGGDRPAVCLHAGSGGPQKCWPWSSFAEVVRRVQAALPAHWILLSGPAESAGLRGSIRRLAEELGRDAATWVHAESLPHLVRRIRGADLYLGNDSGITHLAAWCGIPSIALFGPTNATLWAPPLPWVTPISSPEGCAPCGERYRQCSRSVCLEAISPAHVAGTLVERLSAAAFNTTPSGIPGSGVSPCPSRMGPFLR